MLIKGISAPPCTMQTPTTAGESLEVQSFMHIETGFSARRCSHCAIRRYWGGVDDLDAHSERLTESVRKVQS